MTISSHDYGPGVAHRLAAAFGEQHSSVTITLVLAQCRSDLRGAPAGAMPELLERLATQRLIQTRQDDDERLAAVCERQSAS